MTESEKLVEEKENDSPFFSKRIQYLALVCTCCIAIGDAVEIFLPSVITQLVSCELHVTKKQEHFLALALYLSMGICTILLFSVSDKLGRRPVLLVAIYLAIIVTIVCAVVPNYVTLLASRVLLGVSISLNIANFTVYMAEIASGKQFFVISITLITTFYTVGGGWCGILGYLFLERIGWRSFVLLTSVPLFIPPLILLQFVLPESHPKFRKAAVNETTPLQSPSPPPPDQQPPSLSSAVKRITKLCLCGLAHGVPYFGAILLVPNIVRQDNITQKEETSPCNAMHDKQFLVITVLFGVCHLLGRLLSYLGKRFLTGTTIILTCGVISLISSAVSLLYSDNTMVLLITLGFIQTAGATAQTDIRLYSSDKEFFTSKYLSLCNSLQMGLTSLIIAGSNTLSEMLPYQAVLVIHTVSWALDIPVTATLYFMD